MNKKSRENPTVQGVSNALDSIESTIKRLRRMGFNKPGAIVQAFNMHGVPLNPDLLKKGDQLSFVDTHEHYHGHHGHDHNGHHGGGAH